MESTEGTPVRKNGLLSTVSISDTDLLKKKLIQDEAFWDKALPTNRFSSLYRGTFSDDEVKYGIKKSTFIDICTIVEANRGYK